MVKVISAEVECQRRYANRKNRYHLMLWAVNFIHFIPQFIGKNLRFAEK